jgi:hypothetical protein
MPYSPECVEYEFCEVAPHSRSSMEQLSANLAASATRSTIHLREGPGRFFPSSPDRGLLVNYSPMNRR